MKHRKKIIGVIAVVMLLTALTAMPVMAQPPPPCAFSGDVTVNGAASPGSIVTVKLADGTPVATTPDQVVVGADSRYGVVIPQDPGTLKPAQGDTLNFYVDGLFGGSSTWAAGGIKTLDLAAEPDEVPPPSPSTNWLLVGAIVAASVVAGLVLFLMRRRRSGTA